MTDKDYSHLHGDARLEAMVADDTIWLVWRLVVIAVAIATSLGLFFLQ